MILVDRRTGSGELLPLIRGLGVKAELADLEYGDFTFEAFSPEGRVLAGVERKTIGDLLNCINDGRYAGFQQPGMIQTFGYRILIVEGIWKPSPQGHLLVLHKGAFVHPTGYPVLYNKIFGYLTSVSLVAGTTCFRTSTDTETAHAVVCLYNWGQKRWEDHTSQFEHHRIVFPSIIKPTFERKVAACIDRVGVKTALEAERHFKTAYKMFNADEMGWMAMGLGAKTASQIVKQIHGVK